MSKVKLEIAKTYEFSTYFDHDDYWTKWRDLTVRDQKHLDFINRNYLIEDSIVNIRYKNE